MELAPSQNYAIFNIIINIMSYMYLDIPSWNKLIIPKTTRAIYINIILLLDFVYGVTDIQILKHYVSDAGSTSVFMQEFPSFFCTEIYGAK